MELTAFVEYVVVLVVLLGIVVVLVFSRIWPLSRGGYKIFSIAVVILFVFDVLSLEGLSAIYVNPSLATLIL